MKIKNVEIKRFLKWLEREIKCGIDDLTSKTILKNYHEINFATLLDIFKKNKQKLAVNPATLKIQETLEKHFEESISALTPLKDKIKATDNLIDQIVYKLYGLAAKEIEIVERKE